jgi:hypothetical protein
VESSGVKGKEEDLRNQALSARKDQNWTINFLRPNRRHPWTEGNSERGLNVICGCYNMLIKLL